MNYRTYTWVATLGIAFTTSCSDSNASDDGGTTVADSGQTVTGDLHDDGSAVAETQGDNTPGVGTQGDSTDSGSDGVPGDSSDPSDDSSADGSTDTGDDGFDPESTDGSFYAVGYAGLYMKSSDLGLTWSVLEDQGAGGDDETLYRNVLYLNGVYFRVGNSGRGYWVSTDGERWTDYAVGDIEGIQWIGGVAHGNGLWVGAGGCGATLVSPDAVNWTYTSNAPDEPGCEHARTIAFGNGVFTTIGNNGSVAYSATTEDGINFSNYQETEAYGWHSVVFAYGQFWAATADGSAVMVSSDGASWTQADLPTHNYRRASYTAGRLALTTSDEVMLVSTDGEAFSEISAPSLGRVTYGGGVWIGTASSNLYRSDDDGTNWENVNPTDHSVQKCVYAP